MRIQKKYHLEIPESDLPKLIRTLFYIGVDDEFYFDNDDQCRKLVEQINKKWPTLSKRAWPERVEFCVTCDDQDRSQINLRAYTHADAIAQGVLRCGTNCWARRGKC
jgi:hypothetical protein